MIREMRKASVLIMFSMFIFASNVVAFDFNCEWEGYMSCSNDLADESPIYFKFEFPAAFSAGWIQIKYKILFKAKVW